MLLRLILRYPTVYVVYHGSRNVHSGRPEYTVYVGETNDIVHRTFQHLHADPNVRDDWRDVARAVQTRHDSYSQYVIGHPKFNKSLTLDVENRLMHYMSSADSVKRLNNRRTNAQGDYYTSDEFDAIFSRIWLDLHKDDPELFPAEEIIQDSALFKASPFHRLSPEQLEAEEEILTAVMRLMRTDSSASEPDASEFQRNASLPNVSLPNASEESTSTANNEAHNDEEETRRPEARSEAKAGEENKSEAMPTLFVVQGAAGTGKTVLLSHLFYRLVTELEANRPRRGESAPEDAEDRSEDKASEKLGGDALSAFILVNHNEQLNVYNQIALKLGLQKKRGEVVLKPTPFINRFSETTESGRAIPDKPKGRADIVLIDEAHLLLTQGNQGYSGRNQLYDVLRRARVVIAVFDPMQILRSQQQWDPRERRRLFPDLGSSSRNEPDGSSMESRNGEVVRLGEFQNLAPLEVSVRRIRLHHQFRIAAGPKMISWVDHLAAGVSIDPLPADPGEPGEKDGEWIRPPYEVKVFDSPVELRKAIARKAGLRPDGWDGHGLSRLLATYDWPYSQKRTNPDDPEGLWTVRMHRGPDGTWLMGPKPVARNDDNNGDGSVDAIDGVPDADATNEFRMPWNYQLPDTDADRSHGRNLAWAEKPHTINEVGSIFTIQGFDLNVAGVIIGPSVTYRDGHIVFDPDASCDHLAVDKRSDLGSFAKENLRNEFNVLLKRGVHGLYLFAVDPELQKALRKTVSA